MLNNPANQSDKLRITSGLTIKIPMKAKPKITPTIATQARLNAVTINSTKRTINIAHLTSVENHVNNSLKLIFFSPL